MIIDIQDIEKFCEILRKGNKTIALTNGTFDLIHAGHVRYLNEASKLADYLILGLNSDQSVKQYKSDKRPIVPQKERAEVIDSLKAVNYVVIFDETTADKLISKVKPDIYVKGGDYTKEQLPETATVEKNGGEVIILSYVEGKSTTNIVNKIQFKNEKEDDEGGENE